MKILVYPHDMAIGGSQLNAIELAGAVKALGHDVVVYGQPGPLVDRVSELGLEFIPSPAVHRRPTPSVASHLRRVVKERGIDVVHAYEWPPALEAALACAGSSGAVATTTVMSMSVAPFIPANMPLLVGTEQILAVERARGREQVGLLEPPVDMVLNDAEINFQSDKFLAELGADTETFTVSIVSRLAHEMKLEGILCAITAVGWLNSLHPVQLIITGDGPARNEVQAQAQAINEALGVQRIFLAGEMDDPRAAYACADVSIGMGGSALRAMAFGSPLIVQGEQGFWQLLDESSVQTFLWQGWYGVGSGSEGSVEALAETLESLFEAPTLRTHLGEYARALVQERFSLEVAAQKQVAFYQQAVAAPRSQTRSKIGHAGTSARRFLSYQTSQLKAKIAGRYSLDDFNAHPVAQNKQVQQ